jgi:hypothetical protein
MHASRWTAALPLLLVLLSAIALAQGATPSEREFLQALTAALSDESQDVQQAASGALVRMGRKAAAHLVAEMKRLDADARERAVDVLVAIGQASLDEIDRLEKLPAGEAGEALGRVKGELEGRGGIAGFGVPDPDLQRKVREIIARGPANRYISDSPRAREIEALGRPVIPVLLEYLNPTTPHFPGMHQTIATDILGRLCRADDVPGLCRLLDLGWLRVAAVLARIGDRSCVPAITRAMRKGQMSWELAEAIRMLDDPRLDQPIVRFLDEHGQAFAYGTRHLLEIVADRRLAKALPALRGMRGATHRDSPNAVGNEVALGRALALLGDPSGIPLLIRNLDVERRERWLAEQAGKTLNAITGAAIWSVAADGTKTRAAYQEWWEANKDRLVWDPVMRRYRTKD